MSCYLDEVPNFRTTSPLPRNMASRSKYESTRGGSAGPSPSLVAASPASPDLLRHHRHAVIDARLALTQPSTIHSNLEARLDIHAGALSVDATSSLAVLAGRKGLHLVDLEAPFAVASTLHHQTKWDVAVAKFNPTIVNKHYVASTSNHSTLIWDIGSSLPIFTANYANSYGPQQPLVATLRGHTRPVSDVSWAPNEPSLLATCSADAKTHLWDIRTPQRPVQTLNAFTSNAVLVEWHRVDTTTLATAHEGEVRVWDIRASDKTPAVFITAHMQKIYSIDWHPKRMDELLTSSEDATVKIWNITHPRVCQGSITTGAPVWRAKYVPVGDGILTSSHRLDHSIRLWSVHRTSEDTAIGSTTTLEQVHAFTGHANPVQSFVWRERVMSSGCRYQLVSWSKSQELRLWRLDSQHLQACGHIQTVSQSADVSTEENDSVVLSEIDMHKLELSKRHSSHIAKLKFDISSLKNDFAPIVLPPSAVPLSASEYSLLQCDDGEKSTALRVLLTFDEDFGKIGDANASSDEEEDEEESHNRESLVATSFDKAIANSESDVVAMASALPCPRIFGACFSGPNMLVVFDSRVALGQLRQTAATPPIAPLVPGKSAKPAITSTVVKKLPRTYDQLLEMRDSRFSKKKNKKTPARILAGGTQGFGGGALELSSDWSDAPLDGFVPEDGRERSVHGGRRGTNRGGTSVAAGGFDGGAESEYAVHGGSEYLKTYFSNSEFHLPVNHPDHRTSVPMSSSIQGLSLSPPRTSMGVVRNFGGPVSESRHGGLRGVEQSAVSSLQLDLNLRVIALDLSRLCGVSSLLTYGTQLGVTAQDGCRDQRNSTQALDAGTRDLYSWMLKATESRRVSGRIANRRARRGTGLSSPLLSSQKIHPLSRILESLLSSAGPTVGQDEDRPHWTSVSNVCAHNARIASLSGRSDLEQMWSLLELATASNVHIAQQQQLQQSQQNPLTPNNTGQGFEAVATAHPWGAHPFGSNLVNKLLSMYEDSGDLPTLACMVCTLKLPQLQDEPMPDSSNVIRTHHDVSESLTIASSHTGDGQTERSSMSAVTVSHSASHSTPFSSAMPTASPFNRSRTSFNSLTQFLGGHSDQADSMPPAMRSARRSISHNEVPKLSQTNKHLDVPDITGNKGNAKDWPISSRANIQQPSPTLGPRGWKGVEFDKVEQSLKTWSGGSTATIADSSPRPLTSDTFRPPTTLTSSSIQLHRHRGSSIIDSDDESSLAGRILLQVGKSDADSGRVLLSIDPQDELRYDRYKEAYAEVLYRYGALELRADVLKTTTPETSSSPDLQEENHEKSAGLQFAILCRLCESASSSLYCASCRDFSVKCSLCQLVVRGQSMYCMTCGHGGHEQHMREWFAEENACPTGCGCWCKQATSMASSSSGGRSEHLAPAVEGRLQSRSYSF